MNILVALFCLVSRLVRPARGVHARPLTADRDPVPARTSHTSRTSPAAREPEPHRSVLPPVVDAEAVQPQVAMVRPYYQALEKQRAQQQERDRVARADRDRLGLAVLHDIARQTPARRAEVAA